MLESLAEELAGAASLAAHRNGFLRIGDGKVGVELGRPLKMRDPRLVISLAGLEHAHGKRLVGFEGGRLRTNEVDALSEPALDIGERLAELHANASDRLGERAHHLFFGQRLCRLADDVFPVWQFVAFSVRAYELPSAAMEPDSVAFSPARTQTSIGDGRGDRRARRVDHLRKNRLHLA